MNYDSRVSDIGALAPAGYHIALRVGFAFPLIEINEWPQRWIDRYSSQRFVLRDPVMNWVYNNTGAIRWSEIETPDPAQVLRQAASYGLRFGVSVACRDASPHGLRSFGSFCRSDRDFHDSEIQKLKKYVKFLHNNSAPPKNITPAELEALSMIRCGLRHKEVAFRLGISEGAVKQRLRNAKVKLNATTVTQAASRAHELGLV